MRQVVAHIKMWHTGEIYLGKLALWHEEMGVDGFRFDLASF